ncbi:MAG: response regulator [Anaerolineales bacterium]|nr:response regulator [Anaerolineales bacterium]
MKTLFLADGENHVRKAVRLAIENQEIAVISGEAENAESLLAQVCLKQPDIVLMDWNLPGTNHQRLIQIIRDHCPSTCLYAMSVKPEDERIIQDYPVDGFLSKQMNPEIFIQSLIKIVQK